MKAIRMIALARREFIRENERAHVVFDRWVASQNGTTGSESQLVGYAAI